jgi:hypothetical protein|uniref:Uncharacterized protein n=1 Tax=viral metagenome TaxID=1070528 RepID=A0A6C0LFW1_9ZZZZ
MFSIHDIEFYNLYSYTKIPINKKQLEDYDADNEQEEGE